MASDVVLGAIGIQWCRTRAGRAPSAAQLCWRNEARQLAIECDEAGATAEDAIEPRLRGEAAVFLGAGAVCLESGVEVPDQLAHTLLGGAVVVGERIQLVHQPFSMHPAQRVAADGELPGIITQHDGIT